LRISSAGIVEGGQRPTSFEDVGWESAAKDLNRKLTIVLRPGTTNDQRQQILNAIDSYSYVDPAEYVRNTGIVGAISAGIGRVPATGAEETAASESIAAEGEIAE